MKYFWTIVLVVVLSGIAGCASKPPGVSSLSSGDATSYRDQAQRWKALTGRWYGERKNENGGRAQWITERRARGAYQINFRRIDNDGRVSETVEVGEWGVSGSVFFTIFKGWMRDGQFVPNDISDPANRDAYRIISLSGDTLRYQHLESGEEYQVTRVSDTFEFPTVAAQ